MPLALFLMASSPLESLSFLVIFFLLAAAAAPLNATSGSTPHGETKTHMRFYYHEMWSGPGAGTVFVAGPREKPFVPFAFGDLQVLDDALREGPDPSSRLIGRAQGLTVFASMDGQAVLALMSMVFTEGEYDGSTIEVVGRVDASGKSERAIIGGSGKFRLARGYAISQLISATNNTAFVVEFDVNVTH